jgi:hypothetical protein
VKAPLAVAEQLAFEHLARHRGAVEGDERLAGAAGGAMDGARQHFLAGAGLAGEEDGDVGRRDALGDRQQLGHLLGHPQAAVGLEGVGGPQRGALLLLAAVAVEGDGGVDQLADGDAGAAVVEVGLSSATISQVSSRWTPQVMRRRSPGCSAVRMASASVHPSDRHARIPSSPRRDERLRLSRAT